MKARTYQSGFSPSGGGDGYYDYEHGEEDIDDEFSSASPRSALLSAAAASEQQDVVFLGIIDTLVPFKLRKKAEHVGKSIFQHGKNFSVIPPEDFKERFIHAMNDDIITSIAPTGAAGVAADKFVV